MYKYYISTIKKFTLYDTSNQSTKHYIISKCPLLHITDGTIGRIKNRMQMILHLPS